MTWRTAVVAHEWRSLIDQLKEAGTAGATAQLFDLYHQRHADWYGLLYLIPPDLTDDQKYLLDHLFTLSTLPTLEAAAEQIDDIPAHIHRSFS